MSSHPPIPTRQDLALRAVLRVLRPLVRLLVREGVAYPALAAALKPVFVQAAQAELATRAMKPTASALSLLSGVHRKDLRAMASPVRARGPQPAVRLNLVGQVVARWMNTRGWQVKGIPRALPRSGAARSFDALVAGVSQDVRARAVLDEMLRLGVVLERPEGLVLAEAGLAPHGGFDAMTEALAVNLHDHAAAAAANLTDVKDGHRAKGGNPAEGHHHLDQAIYVDEITDASVAALRQAASQAWKAAFTTVMAQAQLRFDADARDAAPKERARRLRFGVYCYDAPMDDATNDAEDDDENR